MDNEEHMVELSQEEVGKALVEFAARKVGVKGSYRHGIQINGVWTTLGDGPPVVVSITELSNVVRIHETPKSEKS